MQTKLKVIQWQKTEPKLIDRKTRYDKPIKLPPSVRPVGTQPLKLRHSR